MFKTLLVPLDGSELSESILPRVIAVAKPSNARVVLLQAHEPLDQGVRVAMGQDLAGKLDTVTREDAEANLNKVAGDLANQGIRADIALAEGKPAEAILEYVSTHTIDLILMASHGRSGLSRWAFGSVAEKVLRQSPVPVLIGPVSGARV
jgi:nucleotide-binding universal stress UspA family protein